jgi:hypothetical protein
MVKSSRGTDRNLAVHVQRLTKYGMAGKARDLIMGRRSLPKGLVALNGYRSRVWAGMDVPDVPEEHGSTMVDEINKFVSLVREFDPSYTVELFVLPARLPSLPDEQATATDIPTTDEDGDEDEDSEDSDEDNYEDDEG